MIDEVIYREEEEKSAGAEVERTPPYKAGAADNTRTQGSHGTDSHIDAIFVVKIDTLESCLREECVRSRLSSDTGMDAKRKKGSDGRPCLSPALFAKALNEHPDS